MLIINFGLERKVMKDGRYQFENKKVPRVRIDGLKWYVDDHKRIHDEFWKQHPELEKEGWTIQGYACVTTDEDPEDYNCVE